MLGAGSEIYELLALSVFSITRPEYSLIRTITILRFSESLCCKENILGLELRFSLDQQYAAVWEILKVPRGAGESLEGESPGAREGRRREETGKIGLLAS